MSDAEDTAPLGDRIKLALMDEISTAKIAPGTALEEASLAARFGASRTPVREALRQLEAIGLIEIRPRRGAVVLPMTLPRLMEMFEVTAEMEAMTVRLAANRILGAERAELQRIHLDADNAANAEQFDQYDALNLALHETIYRAAHNDFLFDEMMRLRARLLPFRRTQLRVIDRLRQSSREHGAIIKAIMRGDAAEAELSMREHMMNAGVALARYMDKAEHSDAVQPINHNQQKGNKTW